MLRVEFRLQEATLLVQSCLDPSTKTALLKVGILRYLLILTSLDLLICCCLYAQVIDNQMLVPHVAFLVEKGLSVFLADLLASYTYAGAASAEPTTGSVNSGGSSHNDDVTTHAVTAGSDIEHTASTGTSHNAASSSALSGPLADLRRLFVLLERVKDLESLKRGWAAFIRRHGLSIVSTQDPEREKVVIEELLHFHDNIELVLFKCFGGHDEFKSLTRNSISEFINEQQKKPAELLARYLDRKLRGEKGTSDAEVESTLDRCMKIFRFLQEKDTFEAFYKKLLSKRLLLGKSANFELEKAMISKLKAECGSNYTAKLEGMFQDIELSKDVMLAYQQYVSGMDAVLVKRPLSSAAEFHAQVLTTGFWPTPSSGDDLVIPPELRQLQDHFNTFYAHKYQGRRLAWAHSLERCVLTAHFPRGKKELEVSYYQSLVLLCFNNNESLTLADLRLGTRLEEGELKRTLLSLACGMIGTRVLSKEPKGKEVKEGDTFSFNADFTSKFYRIKINTIQLKESSEEVERTHEEVFRERQYQVDAVIVRTMKARKTLPHATLMSELLLQLKFPARPADLKKRIETLIEREYIARDANDPSLYIYLA